MTHDARRSPKQPDEAPTAKQIGIRVPIAISDQLEAIAKRENNGISAVVRRLLTAALADSNEAA